MPQPFDLAVILDIEHLPDYLKQVDAGIDKILGHEKSTMHSAILRLIATRGKRLRPALVIASALAAGTTINEHVLNACISVELIHIASLIHDDIIDAAAQRRTVPTINTTEGVNTAILAGDYLFAQACRTASLVSSDAAGIAADTIMALCKGESYELEQQYNFERTELMLERAIYGKTASLIAASCELGALCAGDQSKKRAALQSFGKDFGMSFQLVDDVLDFVSSDKLLGKPVGSDIKSGVYTLPVITALSGPDKDYVHTYVDKRVPSNDQLTNVLLQNGSIAYTLQKATDLNEAARRNLLAGCGQTSEKLAALPGLYLEWACNNLVAPQFRTSVRGLRALR